MRGDDRHPRRRPRPQSRAARQVASAGLGQRLANSWRDKHYPNQKLDAASLVYTKAPQIIRAFDEGAVIRSRRGRFLAIPTENAPRKGTDGRRISPALSRSTASARSDWCLARMAPRSWSWMDCAPQQANRRAQRLPACHRSARRSGQGLTTVVMFLLVPQVKLSKRLDVARAAERWSTLLPALIEQQLRTLSCLSSVQGPACR